MRPIYTTVDADAALAALEAFEQLPREGPCREEGQLPSASSHGRDADARRRRRHPLRRRNARPRPPRNHPALHPRQHRPPPHRPRRDTGKEPSSGRSWTHPIGNLVLGARPAGRPTSKTSSNSCDASASKSKTCSPPPSRRDCRRPHSLARLHARPDHARPHRGVNLGDLRGPSRPRRRDSPCSRQRRCQAAPAAARREQPAGACRDDRERSSGAPTPRARANSTPRSLQRETRVPRLGSAGCLLSSVTSHFARLLLALELRGVHDLSRMCEVVGRSG